MPIKILGSNSITGSATFSGTKSFSGVMSSGSGGIVAYAGGGQANATVLSSSVNIVSTCATALDSVVLPTVSGASGNGVTVTVVNNGAADLAVYPHSGSNILSFGTTNALWPIHPGCSQIFFYESSGDDWYISKRSLKYIQFSPSAAQFWKPTGGISALTIDGTARDLPSASAILPRSSWTNPVKFRLYMSRAIASYYGLQLIVGGGTINTRNGSWSLGYNEVTHRNYDVICSSAADGTFEYGQVSGAPTDYWMTIAGYWVIG